MIVYQSTKDAFIRDVLSRNIDKVIHDVFLKKLHRHVNEAQRRAWQNSMAHMSEVLRDDGIPADSGVSIEYQIPQTSKLIDFILTGQDEAGVDHAVIIELKQWSEGIHLTEMDGLLASDFYGATTVSHPSYQAWSYAAILRDFNETVYTENIQLQPCAYLHNYIEDDVITNSFYSDYLEKAPVFLFGEAERQKLRSFIKRFVRRGDKSKVMYRIEGGKIRPSKGLAESLAKMLEGKPEFVMIDDQKVVYETALALVNSSSAQNKNVLIVKGGPGTGKSVVAINVLAATTRMRLNTQYVSKNAALRAVFQSMLTGSFRQTEIANFFNGSGSYIDVESNIFDALVVDEAQRLVGKGGAYMYLGENQIKEIIDASKFSVFFLDEDQKVTWHDIGTIDEIEKWAKGVGAKTHRLELASQWRCAGSDGYLAWLDDTLQVRPTAHADLVGAEYDFQVIDSPNKLRDNIFEKNKEKNKARIVAGYCWDWVSKKNKNLMDISIPAYDFAMKWNLATDGYLYIVKPESVNEVGCIHTTQGLEMDYVGVIVGPDLIVRDGVVVTDPSKRAKSDASLKGYKKAFKENPVAAQEKADAIIKNTYRTLMTRGMKGCYVYFTDKETEEYFKSRMGTQK